jgi:hypothetical protein
MPGSDVHIIRDLEHGTERLDPEDMELKDIQLLELTEEGSQKSIQASIPFSGQTLSSQCVNWTSRRTRLEFPIQVFFNNYPVDPTGANRPQMGMKSPGWICFLDHQILDAEGVQLIGESAGLGYWTAGFHTMMTKDSDWLLSDSQIDSFALDDSTSTTSAYPATITPSAGTATTNSIAYTGPGSLPLPAVNTLPITGSTFNAGVAARLGFWQSNMAWTPSTSGSPNAFYSGTARICVADSHPYWEGLGTRRFTFSTWNITPALNVAQNSPIFVVPSSLPSGYTTPPVISIPNGTTCKLRYECVIPGSKLMKKLEALEQKSEGYFYVQAQYGQPQTNVSITTSQQLPITNAVVRPEVVATHIIPTNITAAPGGTSASYPSTGWLDLFPFAQDSTYALSQQQVQVDNIDFFGRAIARPDFFGKPNYAENFYMYQDLAPGTLVPAQSGGLIDWWRYQYSQNFKFLNISRDGSQGNARNETNKAIQLQHTFVVNNGNAVSAPYSYLPIVYRLDFCVFHKGHVSKPGIPPRKAGN